MTQHRLSEAGGTRRLIPSLRGSGAAEPPRAHLARRPSPGSRGPARPPARWRPSRRDCSAQEWRPPRPGAAPEPPGTDCLHRGPTCGLRWAGGRWHSDTARAALQPLRPLGATPLPSAAPACCRLLTQALPRRGFHRSTTPSARETYLSAATAIR